MLIRFVISNLFSFKEQTEFNMLPSKVQHLSHHKMKCGDISFLRMAAIYGANGAGKTNMIKSMALLGRIVRRGKITNLAKGLKFKLSHMNETQPSSMAVEFVANHHIYYYTITFDDGGILYEYLSESHRDQDIRIFEREYENEREVISFKDGYTDDPKNQLFVDVLSEKLINRDSLLLSFLNENYSEDFPEVSDVFKWFTETLVIIEAGADKRPIAQMLDNNADLLQFSNSMIRGLDTGIYDISIDKKELKDEEDKYSRFFDLAPKRSKGVTVENKMSGDMVTIIKDGDKVIAKRVLTKHRDDNGQLVDFGLGMESDGTKRLLDYLPFLYDVIYSEHVYLIDEIERSIHPVIIKSIISMLSREGTMKGQLIFTTHESCLLDQDVMRTDEIWFAQKDGNGGTKMYSLSDYKVHHTANIENGYLNGRYGAIPFVSNLKDIHWENE